MSERARALVRRAFPWVLSAVVVAALLRAYPLDRIAAEVAHGEVRWLFPIALAKMILSVLIAAAADRLVVNGTVEGARLRYVDLVAAKAGAAVLNVVGYALERGGYGVWIAKRTGARAALAAGAVLFIMAGDLGALAIVASAGAALLGADAPSGVAPFAFGVAGFILLTILTGPLNLLGGRTPAVLAPWRTVPLAQGLAQLGLRTVQIAMLVVGTWIAARAFGLEIPLRAMLGLLPIIMLVGSLPINVAGFGVVSATWLLFDSWASGPKLLAFQFVWQVAVAAAVLARGVPFVARFTRTLTLRADQSG